jgi:hypothetical protein
MRRGLYRIPGADGRSPDVRVEDDGIDIPMEEALYRARGYLPAADDLPWQEEYLNRKTPTDNAAGACDTARAVREQARQEFRARFGKA